MSMEIEGKSSSQRRSAEDHTGANVMKKAKKDGVYDNFVMPEDWPKAGEIDLEVHDLPHKSANTEWWYINGHVHADAPKRRASRGRKTEENGNGMDEEKTEKKPREFSFFASFFRIVKTGHFDDSGKPLEHEYVHSLTWAIVDSEKKAYHHFPVLDPASPKMVEEALDKGEFDVDSRLHSALKEIVTAGNVPLPDKIISRKISVGTEKFGLDFGGNTFKKDKHGNYLLHCEDEEEDISLTFTLKPIKSAVRQGHDGIVQVGVKEETMFYYFIPRTETHGAIHIKDEKFSVTGTAWYDHEFGGEVANKKASAAATVPTGVGHGQSSGSKKQYAWNWLSAQLDDGTDLTATMLMDLKANELVDNYVVIIDGADQREEFLEMDLQPEGPSFVSVRTTIDYPLRWRLTVPGKKLNLIATADFAEQEFISLVAKPAFWEGRIIVEGTIDGKAVKGLGFLERAHFGNMGSLDQFFKKISKEVLKTIEQVLPINPTWEQTRDLVTTTEFNHFMDGANPEVYRKTIIEPLRTIIDRGGKSWRSFACLLCIDAVGGNSERYRHFLAMPEIMHVGSLIVDDIQDKSEVRRGGKSAHLIYGDAIAINAGTAAYFISLHALLELTPWLSKELKVRIYDIYFLTLRAGHAGQAFDIYGLDYMMDEACKSQSVGEQLVARVTCTHRLKSAVPAGCLARMGATLGGGNEKQCETVGMYFEMIGIAFQIIDDVLNLRGFKGNTKDRGEDLVAGKVTYPVAKAMALMENEADRTKLWSIIKSKPQDRTVVEEAIQMMEKAGAIDASVKDAEAMVHKAWKDCDSELPPSYFKMLLRAFGIYVLERHY